jgi:predicted trehalose synthase
MEHARLHSYEELSEHALQQLREATALLKAKSTEQELADYRGFVVNLAERVAGAHTESAEPVRGRARRDRLDRRSDDLTSVGSCVKGLSAGCARDDAPRVCDATT